MIKRDFKYILKRVIIGFLIGMLLFICKNKIAFASIDYSTNQNYKWTLKYHFIPCYDNNGNLSCGVSYPTGEYNSEVVIERNISLYNSSIDTHTEIYPTANTSWLLTYIEVKLYRTDNQYIDTYNYNILFNNFNIFIGTSNLYNNNGVYGYIDTSRVTSKGYFSVLGNRVFSCSYVDTQGNSQDCLSNMSYFDNRSLYGVYESYPILKFDNNVSLNNLEFKIGKNIIDYTGFKSNLLSFFDNVPTVTPPYTNLVSNYLSYYDYDKLNGDEILLPISSFSYNRIYHETTTSNIILLPDLPDDSSQLTPDQQEIVDAVNEIFGQFNPEFWGSIIGGTSVLDAVAGVGITDTTAPLGNFMANSFATGFTGLFEALFQTPLELLEQQLDYDLWSGSVGYTDYRFCLGSYIDGSSLESPKVVLWEYKTGNNTYNRYSVDIPCMTDLYSKINSPSGSFGFTAFYPIYRTIIDGILIYYLLIQILQFYKYVLEPKNSEIEVLEL